METLVVYYSRTGNTRFIAEKIAQNLGADIDEVIDEKNRRGWIGFLVGGYDATVGNKTEIAEPKKNPTEYHWVVVGTPVWNSRPSPAIRTYLSNNDLSGKKISVFCTSQGIGDAKAIARTKALIPNGDFTEDLIIPNPNKNRTGVENKISEWSSKFRFP